MMLYTTLNDIKKCHPCGSGKEDNSGFRKLLNYLGKTKPDKEPLSFKTILDSNGLDDALWCLCALKHPSMEVRLFAVWCARQVEHLDKSGVSKQTNDLAERFAHGGITLTQLEAAGEAAGVAAGEAAWAARAAGEAAGEAAWVAAGEAAWAARAAAGEAAGVAAGEAAWAARAAWAAAGEAARAARAAAWAAAREAAGEAARMSQEQEFITRFCTHEVLS